MERKVLGRGLSALISEPQISEHRDNNTEYIDVSKIKPNKYQPRELFNEEKLRELISSIKEKGVVQPILVRRVGDEFELIAGERRLRAVRSLGHEQIPALIKNVDDLNAIELALIENLQREDLNPVEEARAYERLTEEFGFSQEMIGQAVGKDRATVANSLRILSLSNEIRDFLSQNILSIGHAKVLLSVDDEKARLDIARRVIKNGISVRALENMLRKKRTARKRAVIDNDIRSIEEALQEKLGTKVRIAHGKKRGTIRIEYYSNDDLDRILKVIGGTRAQ